MHMKSRIAIAFVGLSIFVIALLGLFYYMTNRVDLSTVNHIAELQTAANEFSDPSGEIQVKSADDIGYYVNSDYNISIHYGRQVIEMNRNCFESEEFRAGLGKIGIRVLTREEEDGTVLYRVTYWDTPVDQYVHVK